MFSHAVGRRGTADKCHWPVWGALAVFRPHWVCPRLGPVCVLPHLHCSGSRLLSRERALHGVDFPGLRRSDSGFQVFHKSMDSVEPAFCAFPGRSSSGSQELDGRTPWVQGALSPPRSQPPFPCAPVRCPLCQFWEADFWLRPSRRMSTIQNLRKSLVRSWTPVCSLVGDAVSGAEFAPFPSPPASCLWAMGRSAAS